MQEQTMQTQLRVGFVAGFLGALILIVIMALIQLASGNPPAFVGIYQAVFGAASMTAAWVIGGFLFAISGGLWGALFGAFVSAPTVGKGMAFGLLPALWLWIVVAPVMGQPIFFGFAPMQLVLPFVFNVIVWGSFVGWYCQRRFATAVGVQRAVT